MVDRQNSSSTSPAVGRALDILVRLAEGPGPVRAATLARDLGIPRSSIYHIMSVLVDRGFAVYMADEQAYGLGVTSFEIGSAYLRHDPLERLAAPILRQLARALGDTVHLGTLHGTETVYLLKERPVSGPSADVSLVTDVGVRLPAHLTANGRAILAGEPPAQIRALFSRHQDFVTRTGRGPRSVSELLQQLAQDRERGWSEEVELIGKGLRSVGAAVHDHSGRPVAALSTTWSRFHERHDPTEVGAALRSGAARLTVAISGRDPRTETA